MGLGPCNSPGIPGWEPQLLGLLMEQGICGLEKSRNPQPCGKLGVSQGLPC